MKLVIATPLYPPEIGGPATYAKLLEDGLPAKGIEIELVKFGEVRHLPKFIRHYVYYRKILTAARDATAILALDPVSVGLPAMKAAKKLGKHFVVKIVGDYAWEQGRQRFGVTENLDEFVKTKQPSLFVRTLQAIQTRVANVATRVIVPSEYLKDIVSQWGILEEKICVVYNGIELPAHIPMHQKDDGEFLIVSAGRRVPWKGFEAIEQIAREHTNWRVCIASELPRTETLGWIQAADVFVLNSSYEGLSHVLIEALALGAPIIATRVGGNPEVITNEENGLLVPAGDTPALATVLARVFGDGELRARLSARARESAKRFSVETMLAATATVLKNL
jgi:glycosyltransferase involved in cell wall biosynthesis